jgi:hypothetical protein
MVKKFEMERGHELGRRKSHKKQMTRISIPWKTQALIGASTFKSGGEELKKPQVSCEEKYAQPNLGRNQVRKVSLCGRLRKWTLGVKLVVKNLQWAQSNEIGVVMRVNYIAFL